jgi:hypothetical protein
VSNKEARQERDLLDKPLYFHDFDLPSDLIACLEEARPVKPCALQYFERLQMRRGSSRQVGQSARRTKTKEVIKKYHDSNKLLIDCSTVKLEWY